MIYPERVRQARELSGLTQSQLAEQAGVTQPMIAQVERGLRSPSDDLVAAIGAATTLPVSFFHDAPAAGEFPLGTLLFRRRLDLRAQPRDQARAYAHLTLEAVEKLEPRVKGIQLQLPRLSAEQPARAATITRAMLGLAPDTPIPHLLHVVERAGILVLAVPLTLAACDAFSAWAGRDGQRPVIVLVTGAPGERQRYTVAHELGHLVMHQPVRGAIPDLEKEANIFAAEFLCPATAMKAEIMPPVTLTSLARLKPRWGVSIQMLIRRAKDLGIVPDRQYRYLMEQIGLHRWRTAEPNPLAAERPRAVRKIAEVLYGDPIDYRRLADDLNWSPALARQVIEAHATASPVASTTLRVLPGRLTSARQVRRGVRKRLKS
jgi:Zn-dependent peptidase ImmA (M78 family)/DNA-binding XRE family transcriptional regulator